MRQGDGKFLSDTTSSGLEWATDDTNGYLQTTGAGDPGNPGTVIWHFQAATPNGTFDSNAAVNWRATLIKWAGSTSNDFYQTFWSTNGGTNWNDIVVRRPYGSGEITDQLGLGETPHIS